MTEIPKLILIDSTGQGVAKSDLVKGLNQIIEWATGVPVQVDVQIYDNVYKASISELQVAIMGDLHHYIMSNYNLRRHQDFKTGKRGELMIVGAEVVTKGKVRNKLSHLKPAKKKRK